VTDFVCCRLQHRRRKKIAEDACELTDEVKEQFRAMTADRDELQAQIDDLHRQAAAIQCANPRVMQARTSLSFTLLSDVQNCWNRGYYDSSKRRGERRLP
jgi:hypothetical protein